MSESSFPKGCLSALVTPMTEAGELCQLSLGNLVETQIEAGIKGLVVLGTTGESVTHSSTEKIQILTALLEKVAGRVAVIVGVGSASTAASIEFIKIVNDFPIAGVMAVTPYYNTPSQAGLIAHYQALAEASEKPLMLYNVPYRTGVDVSVDTVEYLVQQGCVAAVKDSIGGAKAIALSEIATASNKVVRIYCGDDNEMVDYMKAGADGVVAVISNLFPKQVNKIMGYANESKWQFADAELAKLQKIMAAFTACGPNPTGIKTALAMKGIIASATLRLPLVSAPNKAVKQLAAVLRGL